MTGRAPTGGGLDGRTPGLFSSQFPFVGGAAAVDAVAGGRAIIDVDGSGNKGGAAPSTSGRSSRLILTLPERKKAIKALRRNEI